MKFMVQLRDERAFCLVLCGDVKLLFLLSYADWEKGSLIAEFSV